MIKLTENAIFELAALLKAKDAPAGSGLRLLVSRGGCAGMSYGMKVDTPTGNDTVIESGGVSVFIDPESAPFLKDSVVDYVDDLSDSGFKVINPNASRSCGCGSSFEPAKPDDETELPPAPEPSSDAFACAGDSSDEEEESPAAAPSGNHA